VIEALCAAIDYVEAHPEKINQLAAEVLNATPQIFEALIILTPPEHRPLIYQLFKSTLRLLAKVIKETRHHKSR